MLARAEQFVRGGVSFFNQPQVKCVHLFHSFDVFEDRRRCSAKTPILVNELFTHMHYV